MFANTGGRDNVAIGTGALDSNTIGSTNVALGSGAGKNLTTGSNNVYIASPGVASETGTIKIGTPGMQTAAFLQGVYGTKITGQQVVVNSNGRLGTAPAPAASALKSQNKALGRLRDKVHQQSVELRRQGAVIQRLREQMQNGG